MVRKKDRFWEYAEFLDGRFNCKFCKRNFAGGIPRVKSHLSGIKGRDIDVCSKVPKDVQLAAVEAINGSGPNKKLKTTSSLSDQNSVSAENGMQKESNFLDDLLAKLVLVNGLDLGAIQDSPFLDFIDALTKYGPGYKIPSYSMFKTKLFPNLSMKVEDYVRNVKTSWDKSGCTIISEICHDAKDKTFAIITAYSPEGAVFQGSYQIPNDDLTSSHLDDLARSVIQHLGPKNVVQYIAGSAEIEQPSKSMQIGEHCVFRTQCAGNELQFLFEDICHKVEWVRKMIDKAIQVVSHIHKHNAILSLLRQCTNNQELKQAVPNRVSSKFDMLGSIIEFKKELLLLASSSQWIALVNVNEETGKQVTEIIQGAEFWADGEEILPLCKSLLHVVRLVDSHGSNFGYLYWAMEMAEATLTRLYSCHPEKYKQIWEIFVERQGNIVHPLHAAAAILNPAYMCSESFSHNDKIKEGTEFLVDKLIIVEEREAFLTQMFHYCKKPPELFSCTARTMLKMSHPCEWWDYCGDSVPILKKYAFKILSQPCSTSSIKGCMNGSETVRTMEQWESRPERVHKYLFLKTNALFMEKFRTMRTQNMKPIDLENLDKLPDNTFSKDYFIDLIDKSLEQNPLSELESSWFRSTEKSASQGKVLQLRFKTDISSHVLMRDKVMDEHGASIEIVLVDSETGNILQAGSESMIKLTVVVLEGGFDHEATGSWTHEEFDGSVITRSDGGRPILTGDLDVILNQGVGTVGALTFNSNSSWTASRKFRLGVKATTRCCPSIRIREGISNAFIVEERNYGNDLSAALSSKKKSAMAEGIGHFCVALAKEPQFVSILVEAIMKTVEAKDKQHECRSASAHTKESHTFSQKNQTYQMGSSNQVIPDCLPNIQASHNSCAAFSQKNQTYQMGSSNQVIPDWLTNTQASHNSCAAFSQKNQTYQMGSSNQTNIQASHNSCAAFSQKNQTYQMGSSNQVIPDWLTNTQASHNSCAAGTSSWTPAYACKGPGDMSAQGRRLEQEQEETRDLLRQYNVEDLHDKIAAENPTERAVDEVHTSALNIELGFPYGPRSPFM